MRVYIGLVHYPVYNKNKDIIVSSITTVDIHDIARVAKTYDIKAFYIITPVEEQKRLVMDIIEHWTKGYGARYNPDRKEAISLVKIVPFLSDALKEIEKQEKLKPCIIATDANKKEEKAISYKDTKIIIEKGVPVFLIFGTAWGLHNDILEMADYVLEPIYGRSGYRHLSVRTASAIIIDRLMGRKKQLTKNIY